MCSGRVSSSCSTNGTHRLTSSSRTSSRMKMDKSEVYANIYTHTHTNINKTRTTYKNNGIKANRKKFLRGNRSGHYNMEPKA